MWTKYYNLKLTVTQQKIETLQQLYFGSSKHETIYSSNVPILTPSRVKILEIRNNSSNEKKIKLFKIRKKYLS